MISNLRCIHVEALLHVSLHHSVLFGTILMMLATNIHVPQDQARQWAQSASSAIINDLPE